MTHATGVPCWMDLLTSDTARAREFYGRVLGWTAEEASPEFGGYFMFTVGGMPVAGCMPVQPGMDLADVWGVYLTSADAAGTLAAAVALGATTRFEQIEREVDIVIECTFDGEPIVTSVEVIEHGRPATIEWVERQINKHRYLPTNRLVLVSKSGFSKNARTRVAVEGGWVDAITPKAVEKDGQAVVKSLSIGSFQMKPVTCHLYVQPPGEEAKLVNVPADINIYDSNGTFLGIALELAGEIMGLDFVREKIFKDTRDHPEQADLKGFEFAAVIAVLNYYLRWEDSGELHLIAAIGIEGEFAYSQEELAFSLNDMANLRYGVGEAPVLGHPAVWVATTDEKSQTTTISWRAKDDKPFAFGTGHFQATKFPAVMNLKPPPVWMEEPDGSRESGQPENSPPSQG